jgi:hypothetical protein
VDRVEVLRGPQGTLFGRNATGGLANFITRKPTDQDGGYVDVAFGQRNLMRIEGASIDEFRAAVDEAHRAGIPVAVHVYSGDALDNAIEAGVDSIEHGFDLTDAQLGCMKAEGTANPPEAADRGPRRALRPFRTAVPRRASTRRDRGRGALEWRVAPRAAAQRRRPHSSARTRAAARLYLQPP